MFDQALLGAQGLVTGAHAAKDKWVDLQAERAQSTAGQAQELNGHPGLNQAIHDRGDAVGAYARVTAVTPFLALRNARDPQAVPLQRDQALADDLVEDVLNFNDRVFVLEEYAQNWVKVRTDGGKEGYFDRNHVIMNPPEPGAQLYRTRSGDTALGIAQQHFNCGKWGEDGRFFTNVLVKTNDGDGKPNQGIHTAQPNGSWRDAQVRSNHWIWIPSDTYARSLSGVVDSGSISKTALEIGEKVLAFTAGWHKGLADALADVVMDVVGLAGMLWDALKSLVSGTLIDDIKDFVSGLASIDPSAILDAFVGRWDAPDNWDRFQFRGHTCAYLAMTVAIEAIMATLSAGASLAARAGLLMARFGRKLLTFVKSTRLGRKLLGGAAKTGKANAKALNAAVSKTPSKTPSPTGARVFSQVEAEDLIRVSEGRNGLPNSRGRQFSGHAGDHIALDGADPKVVATLRPRKANTTVYRKDRHAFKDLRDALTEQSEKIDGLTPGQSHSFTYQLGQPRQGFNSVRGATPTEVSWSQVTVAVEKLPTGEMHLAHFSPKI